MVRVKATCGVAAMLQEFYQRLLPWSGQRHQVRLIAEIAEKGGRYNAENGWTGPLRFLTAEAAVAT
jgi:hypothetical protein